VILAGSGVKAIEAVQTNPEIDLILMDIDLKVTKLIFNVIKSAIADGDSL
jgi:CheY-like chemotaxis protein